MKEAFKYIVVNYFLAIHSLTASGAITLSTKVYAPLLGDFTILMALVNLFELVCKLATVFFAIINSFIVIPSKEGILCFI